MTDHIAKDNPDWEILLTENSQKEESNNFQDHSVSTLREPGPGSIPPEQRLQAIVYHLKPVVVSSPPPVTSRGHSLSLMTVLAETVLIIVSKYFFLDLKRKSVK